MRDATQKINLKYILPIVCILDILLFPYVRFLSCSLSMLLLLCWYLINVSYAMKMNSLICIILIVVMSMIVGFFVHGRLIGLSSSIIFIFSFGLFFYFLRKFREIVGLRRTFKRIIEIYLLIACVFVGIYMVSPEVYFSLRSFWTMGGEKIEYTSRVINRFTFLFSDPNNAGCMFVSLMAYLLLFGEQTGKRKILYTIVGSVCAIATFSVTAVGMLLCVLCLLAVPISKDKKWLSRALLFMIGMLLLLLFALGMGWMDKLLSNEMINSLLWRIETNVGYGGTLGGRADFWKVTIENACSWYNVLIGKGAVVDNSGVQYLPHSAHLFIFISYGLGASFLFYSKLCYLGRRVKWVKYIPLLPCFAIFTINTGLTDYRFMALYVCLFAAMYVSNREIKQA